jgi:sulfane dehydrogenase subunit SoxC
MTQAPTQKEQTDDLYLRPVDGMARFLGRGLTKVVLRAVSMIEQDPATVAGPLSPVDGYFRRDRHLHPTIDPGSWKLAVDGVASPRSFSLDELRAMPRAERICVMECAGNGNHMMGSAGLLGCARWEGIPFEALIGACGGPGPARYFAFHGLDGKLSRFGYHYGLSYEELTRARAILALKMNGQDLPRKNGFPLRLVVPGVYSMSHVKWLGRIEGKTEPHRGIHNTIVFVNKEKRDGRWVKVQARWIGLKSMITRCRRDEDGYELTGWAWGGERPITRVAVSCDGGQSWADAALRPPTTFEQGLAPEDMKGAWSIFTFRWRSPAPGKYLLGSRAFDEAGAGQDLVQDPNVEGHYNQTRVKWREVEVPA